MTRAWEVDFVAVSATLGEPMSATLAALGESGAARAGEIAHHLQGGTRTSRAVALAKALAEVAEGLEGLALR